MCPDISRDFSQVSSRKDEHRRSLSFIRLLLFSALYVLYTLQRGEISLTLACCAQVSQMQHGLSVVADLTGGDAEMQRAVQETIKAFGGLDIIVNRCSLIARIYCSVQSSKTDIFISIQP